MPKTREEVEKLKKEWKADPVWDIEDTEGFEDYKEELLAFSKECEAAWEKEWRQKEQVIEAMAEDLGLVGLYRIVLSHQELLERHKRAIELLANGESFKAYRILQGGQPD